MQPEKQGSAMAEYNLERFVSAQAQTSDARVIMDPPDDKKLRSSMKLFAEAEPECEVFQKVLDKFFGGRKDRATLKILNR